MNFYPFCNFMDKIIKALKKLNNKERKIIKEILIKIKSNNFSNFDLKKLKNRDDIFRIRKGSLRIIFQKINNQKINILAIERRSDNTYKKH